jgi:diguanylate cyclase (GGDEF)-like protein
MRRNSTSAKSLGAPRGVGRQGQRRHVDAAWAFPGATVALAVAYTLVPVSAWSELILFDGAALMALVGALVGWRRSIGDDRRFPLAAALALGCFAVGELTWWTFTARGLDPFPSIADGAYLLGYLPVAGAAAVLASTGGKQRDKSAWLDAGILTAVAGLICWAVLLEPNVNDQSVSGIDRAVTLSYPLVDLMVLGFLLVLLLSRVARDGRCSLFAAGVGLTLSADLAFAYQDIQGSFSPGGALDLTWLSGYALISAAALAPAGRYTEVAEDAGMGAGRLVCTVLAVLVPQAAIASELLAARLWGWRTLSIAVGVATLTLFLVSLRMWGLIGRARRHEQRRGTDRLSTVIHHSTDAIVLVDGTYRISFASPAFGVLAGMAPIDCVGTSLLQWLDNEHDAVVRQFDNLQSMPSGAVVPLEGLFTSNDDVALAVEGTACNLLFDPSIASFVVTLRDVSIRRELEAQLERRAFHDDLTGLANRALFADRVTHALTRLARSPETGLAVVFLDLDDFKAVNDGMGHAAGDELLEKVADRLRTCLRPADTIARFGGDEFAVLLEDITSADQAREFADRIVEVLRLPVELGDLYLAVPVSAGVALASPDSTNESLMRDADLAMYSAKAKGKCCVVVFDDTLRQFARERLTLKVEIPQALRAGEFELYYQPIYDMSGKNVLSGFEALLRWNHPKRGEVGPLDFVPLAEETGDIVDIGRWVLEQACLQAVTWNRQVDVPLSMSVNVSAVQLHHSGFVDDVRGVLQSSGLPGSLLTIEITESVFVEHQRVAEILDQLRTLGIGIAIDDFGTGYSSLAYLKRFPVTSVKIDRSFVMDLVAGRDVGIVRSIIAMADALVLSTVAEGVENIEQLQLLSALDCGLAQGYFLGVPQRAAQIAVLLGIDGDVLESGRRPS